MVLVVFAVDFWLCFKKVLYTQSLLEASNDFDAFAQRSLSFGLSWRIEGCIGASLLKVITQILECDGILVEFLWLLSESPIGKGGLALSGASCARLLIAFLCVLTRRLKSELFGFSALEHFQFQFGVRGLFFGLISILNLLVFPSTFCKEISLQKLIFPLAGSLRVFPRKFS